jgi:hypothetical protein
MQGSLHYEHPSSSTHFFAREAGLASGRHYAPKSCTHCRSRFVPPLNRADVDAHRLSTILLILTLISMIFRRDEATCEQLEIGEDPDNDPCTCRAP